MSFRDFEKRIRKRANLVGKNATKGVRAVAIAVDNQVTFSTPVDTGRARANWIASINRPSNVINREPLAGPASAGPAVAEALQVIKSFKESDDAIYISNSVSYINELNDGSSAQAPRNFVQKAIIRGIKVAKKIKLLDLKNDNSGGITDPGLIR